MKNNLFFGVKKSVLGCSAIELSKEEFKAENREMFPQRFDYGVHIIGEVDENDVIDKGQLLIYFGNNMKEGDFIVNGWTFNTIINFCSFPWDYKFQLDMLSPEEEQISKTFYSDSSNIRIAIEQYLTYVMSYEHIINKWHLELIDATFLKNLMYDNYSHGASPLYVSSYETCVKRLNKYSSEITSFVMQYSKSLTTRQVDFLKNRLDEFKKYINEHWPDERID